ncbi:MAG: acetyltransferase [Actinomycetota bacterium]|nr:acetyltransferase [Actinomycetota bacterium]
MRIVVVGAGGHAKVVVEACLAAGWVVSGTVDADPSRTVFGLPHLGPPEGLRPEPGVRAVIAVGSNAARRELGRRLNGRFEWATVVHPAATVSPRARIKEGAVVFAGAVVQADTVVGRHVILNTGCRVDHDNDLGDFCHVGPGAVLAGTVVLGEGAFVGAGAVVTPNRSLAGWCTVGAGGVVVRDTRPGLTYAGVPAKETGRKRPAVEEVM